MRAGTCVSGVFILVSSGNRQSESLEGDAMAMRYRPAGCDIDQLDRNMGDSSRAESMLARRSRMDVRYAPIAIREPSRDRSL